MITSEEFLTAAFAEAPPDARPMVGSFVKPPGPSQGLPCMPYAGGKLEQRHGFIKMFTAGMNNYTSIASFNAGEDGVYRRRLTHFAAGHLILLDDIRTKVPLERIKLRPSLSVETSPGNFQFWYILDKPELDAFKFNGVIQSFKEQRLTDGGGSNIVRVGRLPVGSNTKDTLPAPFQQQVEHCELSLRYALKTLVAAFKLNVRPKPKFKAPHAPRTGDDPIPTFLIKAGYVISGHPGAYDLRCPFAKHHSDPKDTSGAVYFLESRKFHCQHESCKRRNRESLILLLQAARRKA